jgi:hypothetical protein
MALRVFGVGIAASAGFIFLEATHGRAVMPFFYSASSLLGGAVPRAVGVPLLLTCLACFWLTLHGFTVGSLRTKYMELARKDGEKDVDARYSLPNLYVDGLSKHARAFNCAQRSHQQAFETLPQLLFFTLVASAAYPLAAAGNVALWLIGRVTWTNGYVESGGDPKNRYSHPLAFLIFASFMAQFFVAVAAAGELAGAWAALRALGA